MAEPRNEAEDSFKFVDKRRFTDSGDLKQNASAEIKPEPVKEEAPQAVGTPAEPAEITFSLFMQSMAHQVFIGLGLVPSPETNLVAKNFEQARQTIDIMTMLRKTAEGNLSADDAKMLDGLLYELRMTFVRTKEGSLGGKPN